MVGTCTHGVHYYISGLLDDTIAAISSKSLPHYFLPQVNLFENIPDDFLHTVGKKLVEFRRNPISSLPKLSTKKRDALLSKKSKVNNNDTELAAKNSLLQFTTDNQDDLSSKIKSIDVDDDFATAIKRLPPFKTDNRHDLLSVIESFNVIDHDMLEVIKSFPELGTYNNATVISRLTGSFIETDQSGEIINQLEKLRGTLSSLNPLLTILRYLLEQTLHCIFCYLDC